MAKLIDIFSKRKELDEKTKSFKEMVVDERETFIVVKIFDKLNEKKALKKYCENEKLKSIIKKALEENMSRIMTKNLYFIVDSNEDMFQIFNLYDFESKTLSFKHDFDAYGNSKFDFSFIYKYSILKGSLFTRICTLEASEILKDSDDKRIFHFAKPSSRITDARKYRSFYE